jgi:hypothetical protein
MRRNDSRTDTVFAAHPSHAASLRQQQQQQHGGYPLRKISTGGVSAASDRLQDLQELQGLQGDDAGQLADPWSREAGPEDGMQVLAGGRCCAVCAALD